MRPEVWGPHAWIFLHSITMNYPDKPSNQDKKEMKDFFSSLKYVLPCDKCSKNLQKHMIKYPLTDNVLSSRDSLIRWLIDIHNEVNRDNNKPIYSYSTAKNKLENLYK
ncbi:ERV/ALR sulfhydryl oxidase [Fadolivirus algeromassiliense]|jgi:hypothetical protein|uniref:Sulfhydryl oxidase n=1 Tax=Fadolivirus FV1/VV64 TaxID=3070911 RepID=A0A7D3QV58_9VIRU|nr:ERV/ALR sulfhydryl oxidase [Fadolivirus algeromassiliense]QKF94765.1 ERV/ALR sulfhydryl oxidase [Fadolivirus FV1/VV64]